MNSCYKWGNKVRVQGLTPTSYMTLGKSIYLLNEGNSIIFIVMPLIYLCSKRAQQWLITGVPNKMGLIGKTLNFLFSQFQMLLITGGWVSKVGFPFDTSKMCYLINQIIKVKNNEAIKYLAITTFLRATE